MFRQHAQEYGLELYQVIEELCAQTFSMLYTQGIIARYQDLQDRLAKLRGLAGLELVRALWLPDDFESFDIRNLAETLSLANPEPAELFKALIREITQPELPGSDSDIIRVMSLHKAKGLTASMVVIAGCLSGALPTVDRDKPLTIQDAQREEQRRLFYVAITLATDTLIMSSA
jgi:superfamily I DNA/RNA helicase